MFSTNAAYEKYYITYRDHITNEEILHTAGSRRLPDTVAGHRFCMAGHVLCLPSQQPARVAMNWTPDNGRRWKGRPRTTWRRTFQADLALVGIRWEEAEDTAPGRSFWRQVAARRALWHRWN